jgi:hypothetical protein
LDEFAAIIDSSSIKSPAREKLADVFRDAKQRQKELTLNRIAEQASPVDAEKLALLMLNLVNRGLAKRIVRVEGPEGGIKDFASVVDIPPEILDWHTDREMHVTPENIKIIYKF